MVISQRMVCLRRLTGVFRSRMQTSHTFNNNNTYCNFIYGSSRFMSVGSQTQFRAKETCVTERIEKGDIVNLSQLLFHTNRDYLIRHNQPKLVKAEHLVGRVIVIYFMPLHFYSYHHDTHYSKALMETYNDLKSNNCFEVVLVVVDDDTSFDEKPGQICFNPSFEGKFEDICSQSPSWPAIPFSDITSRQFLKRKFGLFRELYDPEEVLIDSKGMVLNASFRQLCQTYGSEAYPFSYKRISFLKSRDKTAFCQPSLKELLGSSERNYVISNTGDKVPICTLEDKVVAIFFYEDGCLLDSFTRKLKMCYEELKKKNKKFEVVLLYLSDTLLTISSTNEETFRKTFNTMPWLALPYKDPAHKKLRRLFGYPYEWENESVLPSLVIVGPRTEIIEPGLATILRGYDSNLFMHEELGKVEGERVWELKLEMLCSPNTVFKRKDGSQVQFSQLRGKRIIFLFEGDCPEYDGYDFRNNLKKEYMNMKGTADEFEVIYFPNSKDKNGKRVADVPWLVSCSVELLTGCSAFLSFYGKSCNRYQSSFLLAFGRDGSLVRRTICPRFEDYYFPFADAGGETEASGISGSDFCWGYWDTLYKELLRDSYKQTNYTGGDLLFSVYWT